jgi:hypothetical protein
MYQSAVRFSSMKMPTAFLVLKRSAFTVPGLSTASTPSTGNVSGRSETYSMSE